MAQMETAEATPTPERRRRFSEALLAVFMGVGALVAITVASIVVFHSSASTAAAVIGAASAPIATLIGAYFGIRTGTDAGSAGKAEAEQARAQAEQRALALAGQMEPHQATRALAALGVPMPEPLMVSLADADLAQAEVAQTAAEQPGEMGQGTQSDEA